MLAGECKCACVAVELVSSVSEWQVQKYIYVLTTKYIYTRCIQDQIEKKQMKRERLQLAG